MADPRAREYPIVNPEHCAACLRELVRAADCDEWAVFLAALADARKLLAGAAPRKPGEDG